MPNAAEFRELAELPTVNPLPVLLCDADGRVLYRNPAAQEFPDRFPPDVDRIEQVLPEDFPKVVAALLESGRPLKNQLREVHGRTLSLTYQPLETRREIFVIIVDETEQVEATRKAQAYAADLEEAYRDLRDAQAQLIQSAKMAALGSLVSGIAHDLNSPLGALTSNSDTQVRGLAKIADALAEYESSGRTDRIRQAARLADALQGMEAANRTGLERISNLVKSLRSFARLDRAPRDDVDLHEGLESALTLLAHELQRGIEVRRQYGLNERVRCSPGQVNQVFMNLLLNAAQAIPASGVIGIRTYREGHLAAVEISDDGEGILPANLERIFDPGFTTRGVGVGTGLGLPVAYRVIHEHGGRIAVTSEPGEGSTFRVTLPLQPPSVKAEPAL